jgi:hypothetical protein
MSYLADKSGGAVLTASPTNPENQNKNPLSIAATCPYPARDGDG